MAGATRPRVRLRLTRASKTKKADEKAAASAASARALAADVMAEAIVRAVRAAVGIPGYPAARDLPADQ